MTKFYKVPSSQALPLVPLPGLSWISSEAQLAGRDRCHIPRACLGLCPFSETPLARRPLRGRRPLHPLCGSLPLPGPRLKQCWGAPVRKGKVTLSGLPCHCLGGLGSAACSCHGRLQALGMPASGSLGLSEKRPGFTHRLAGPEV